MANPARPAGGAADKVLRVGSGPPYLLHLEFVTGHDAAQLPPKLHKNNSLLVDRHGLPVCSAAVLLRPEADSPRLTGLFEQQLPDDDEPYLAFRYRVLRVWWLAPEPLLTGGIMLMPLALISAVTEADLPGIIKRIEQRLTRHKARRLASTVWAAAYILSGLRYSPDLARVLFRGVVSMKESATYQAIVEEGRAEGRAEALAEAVAELKNYLRVFGTKVFGPPDARTARIIDEIDDLTRLREVRDRVSAVNSWQELFGQPTSRPRSRRRQSP